jgi:hypothetical protein
VSNDDFRRELNSVFDNVSGSPSSNLRERVRSSISDAPAARGPFWVATIAAAVIAVLIIGVLFVANPARRPTSSAGGGVPTAGPSASPSTSPESNLPPFQCGTNIGPITQDGPAVAFVSNVRTGSHPGYDRITVTFSNGAPREYELKKTSSAAFTQGASGQTIVLPGSAGLLIIIRGADEHTNYSGPTDFKTGYKEILEARQVEDFEGTVQWGLGLSTSACHRAFLLTNPDRLVIDIQTS